MRRAISTAVFSALLASGFVMAQSGPIVIRGEASQYVGAIKMEMGGPEDAKVVKGIPLTAEIVTTHVQHLADGNTIKNEDTATFYRDSEGRTRRESKIMIPGADGKDVPTMIMINDPVAHTRFVLNRDRKFADQIGVGVGAGAGHGIAREEANVMYMKKNADEAMVKGPKEGAETITDLGVQTVEGFAAHGTRSSHEIPAGQIGNEKPITVTTERWYSDDLGMEVMRVHNDPWAGEVTTKVTNVKRGEPDASLFAPPADYKVQQMDGKRVIRIENEKSGADMPGPPPPPQD